MFKTRQQSKSSRSRWRRFVYAFATIVTVFAQIGAAVPALTSAARTPEQVGAGLTITEPTRSGNLYTITVKGQEPADGESFTVNIIGSGLMLNGTKTNIENGSAMGASSQWVVKDNYDGTMTVTRNDNFKLNATDKTVKKWPMKIRYTIKDGAGGLQIDGSDQPPVINGKETNALKLGVYNSEPTTYQAGQTVNLQVSDDKMISGGEVDVVSADVSKSMKFDHDQTVELLKKMGYASAAVDTTEVQTLAPDAASSKVEKFTKADGTYFYLLDSNGDARIAWPDSDGKTQRVAGVAMVAVGEMAATTLTPKYLSGSLKDTAGTGVALTITKPAGVDGTKLRLNPHSVALDKVENGVSVLYRLSSFPLFYMKETGADGTQLYSFIYDSIQAGNTVSLPQLRRSVIAGDTPYSDSDTGWGKASSTSNTGNAYFENFHQIAADGNFVPNSEQQFEIGKVYSLIPYRSLPGNRFPQINTTWNSKNYYMPDGIPEFTVDASGNLALKTSGDGKAIKGQWQANKNVLDVNLHRVKYVKVVDDDPDPKANQNVAGATVKLKNTSGGASYMTAKTGSDGTGMLLPNDYVEKDKGPFYYADGTQTLDTVTFDKGGYTADGASFDMTLGTTDDKLSLTNQAKATVSPDGQTVILTVHKITEEDTQINIEKVAQADPTKSLPGATLHVEEVNNSSDPIKTQDVTTKDDGSVQLSADSSSKTAKRVFHVTENAAPEGYDIGRAEGYFAVWEVGKGFTAVGETDAPTATTSSDKLVSIKDGKLIIQDPTKAVVKDNGGALTLAKVDKTDGAKTPPDGARFSLSEVKTQEDTNAGAKQISADETTSAGKVVFDLGAAKPYTRYFNLVEQTAPSGYVWNTKIYAVKITADGVVSVGAGEVTGSNATTAATDKQTTDKVLTVGAEEKSVIFADDEVTTQKNGVLKLKKTDLTDRTKGLAGAEFGFTENIYKMDPRLYTADGKDKLYQSDANGNVTVDLGAPTNTTRQIKVNEINAPAGYEGNGNTYKILIDPDGKYQVTDQSGIPSDETADHVLKVENNQVTFGDVKKEVPMAPVTLKKVMASDSTTPLAGARFSFQEVVNSTTGPATAVTSGADGDLTYMAPKDGKLHIFMITETAAPNGYLVAPDPYWIVWQDGKITDYGKATSDAKPHPDWYMNAKLDKTAGVLTIRDEEQSSMLTTKAVQQTANNQTVVGGVQLTLSDPNGGSQGKPLRLTTGADGTVKVTSQQVADVLGLSTDKMAGTVDVHLAVDNVEGQYTAPLARNVKYTFSGGNKTPGFDDQSNDGSILVHQTNTSVPAGDLVALLRQDTLTARGITDANEDAGFVPGAKFTMTFSANGKSYKSPELTIPDTGVLTLPDPNTLLGLKDTIAVNTTYDVAVNLIQAPDGYSSVYPSQAATAIKYTSGTGYQMFAGTPSVDPGKSVTFTELVNDLNASRVTYYTFGGSDMTYYFLKQTNSLAFSDLPGSNGLNLNFGNHEIRSTSQDIPLDEKNADSPFDDGKTNGVTPTTTIDNGSKVGIGVTQQGEYVDGWRVTLEAGALTAEKNADTINGASMTFANGQGTRDQQPQADLLEATQLKVALNGSPTAMLTSDGKTAGQYNAAWNLGDVKLHVPGGQGLPDTHYKADMTWNLIVGEP